MRRLTHSAPPDADRHNPGTRTEADAGVTLFFQLFGKRWTGPIVSVLTAGPAYFADLRRAIPGISERMLSNRLTELATAGLIVREVDEGPPSRVSYRLTEAGTALKPAFTGLAQWAQTHLPETGGPADH
ncbi:winged helix-turn-helix transcriptional regulator [Streptomyces sp. NPDC101776]|uniref:winged helix-turn-helix transcriptional regulator n=1 Tax=Streptomyces sp. NPDC101776 TaxID=3366146 RepID=UPI0037FC4384